MTGTIQMPQPSPQSIPTPPGEAGRRRSDRVTALAVLAVCLAILGIGAGTTPSAEGHGTHRQLGLPPCGFVIAFNKPCMTCGMTTAVSEAAHGRIWRAAVTQPMGLGVAILAAAGVWVSGHTAVTGSRLLPWTIRFLTRPRILWMIVAAVLLSWAYKLAIWPGAA